MIPKAKEVRSSDGKEAIERSCDGDEKLVVEVEASDLVEKEETSERTEKELEDFNSVSCNVATSMSRKN